jgi:hypothetical protein
VRFARDVAEDQKQRILDDEPSIVRATLTQSLVNPRMDVFTVEALDTDKLLREAHWLAKDPNIEFATPVFHSHGVDQIPTGELFVQFKASAADGVLNVVAAEFGLELVKKTTWKENNYLLRTTTASELDVIAVCAELLKRNDVEYSQPNFIRLMKRLSEPDDDHFDMQWSLHNTAQLLPGYDPPLLPDFRGSEDCDGDAPEAWCMLRGCENVVIAIIDEGMDMTHPDYVGRLVAGWDVTDGDSDCTPLSTDAHGTACAGIAAASTNNALGVAGVDWNARIMPIRIAYSASPPATGWVTTDQWLGDGIIWAYQHGADVLSNSWGGGGPSQYIHDAIIAAVTNGRAGKGAVVVFAAGNDNQNAPQYPCLHPESFCVAATSPCDERKSCHNGCDDYGDAASCDDEYWWGSNYGDGLDVAAPGVKMPTTDIQGADGYCPTDGSPACLIGNDDYTMTFNGTSSATPFVAGLAALVICKYDHYSGGQVRSRIEQTCDKVGGYAYDATTGVSFELGHGRVNIYRALSGKPQVVLGPAPAFPSVYREASDLGPPYPFTHHKSAACEWLGDEYSPEAEEADDGTAMDDLDPEDPDGKPNRGNKDAFDDDDEVRFFPPYIPNQINAVRVVVSVEDSTIERYANGRLYVNVWFDWEADGRWNNTYDWVVQNEVVDPSSWGGQTKRPFVYPFMVPSNDVFWHLQNEQDGRFMNVRTRVTHDQQLQTADELADYGEVEDDQFLNFVEMFDIGQGYTEVLPPPTTLDEWHWIDTSFNPPACHPAFTMDAPAANGYMYTPHSNSSVQSALRTPSFDLRELTHAYLRFEHSAVEAPSGEVRLYKNGILDAILQQHDCFPINMTPCQLVYTEVIDISAWCGDGNDDIMIEFYTWPPNSCFFPSTDYQDWSIDNVVVWGYDVINPNTSALTSSQLSAYSNELDWATPSDDEGYMRQAETYNIRYGPEPITPANWRHSLWVRGDMVAALPVPQTPGTAEVLLIQRLVDGFHEFGLRTMDEVTSISGIGGAGAGPPQTGACCQGASCTEVTQSQCNGVYKGDGTTCNPNPCAQTPKGACCSGSGACTEVPSAVCAGTYQGDGTTCLGDVNPVDGVDDACGTCGNNIREGSEACDGVDDAACPGACLPHCACPSGACCEPAATCTINADCPPGVSCVGGVCQVGACSIRTQSECVSPVIGGVYQGDNTVCVPNPCSGMVDCNVNGIDDSVDISSGTSSDVNGNGIPDECEVSPPPSLQPEPVGVDKNRFISFIVPSSPTRGTTALRVKLTSLHHPAAPVPPGTSSFSAFENTYRYVNSLRFCVGGANAGAVCTGNADCIGGTCNSGPSMRLCAGGTNDGLPCTVDAHCPGGTCTSHWHTCPDSAALGTKYRCAKLGCQPEYRDWASELGNEVLHVTGDAVIPSSIYDLSQIRPICGAAPASDTCTAASPLMAVETERWGNVDNFPPGGVPNAVDISKVVDKVKDVPGAFIEPRCQLQPATPNPYGLAVNALDIGRAVDAVKGQPYPFAISTCP